MAIREELVASAAKFLLDPSVAASPIEKRIAFLQAKNLTQEEVNAALARVGPDAGSPQQYASPPASSSMATQQQPPQYYGQYPPQYPPYAWQPPLQEPPRRDWRDWFIMATVVGGVSYGLFNLGKRYVYPLIAPPTPERLEQDKKSIEDQFEKTFALVEQLAKDTETLKAAEQERTERLDTALGGLETVIHDLISANRRRDDEAQSVRDDVQDLIESIPRAMNSQKDSTDNRLREVNAELKSLKTLITQRMNPTATSTSVSNYLRPSSTTATNGVSTTSSPAPSTPAAAESSQPTTTAAVPVNNKSVEDYHDYVSGLKRNTSSSPFSSGMPTQSKASIPAWQMMASRNSSSSDVGSGPGSSSAPQPASVADAGSSAMQETVTSP